MIISLSGPSGIGKGYIKEKLLEACPSIKELTWLTTRPLRTNESGNRISLSTPEFDSLATSGKLVLVQTLYGHYYGLKKEDLLPRPGMFITELHPDNVHAAMTINSDILAVGLITLDLDFLRRRLSEIRKTENAEEIERRIKAARMEVCKIQRLRSLFKAVIQVTESTQSSTFNQVFAVLAQHIKKGA